MIDNMICFIRFFVKSLFKKNLYSQICPSILNENLEKTIILNKDFFELFLKRILFYLSLKKVYFKMKLMILKNIIC